MTVAEGTLLSWTEGPGVALPLAAGWDLAENSPQGFAAEKINSHQDWSKVNFQTAPGIGVSLRRNRLGPHCQTWNAYAYVRNNPTTLTDPDGTDYNVCTNDQNGNQTCTRVTNDVGFEQALNNPGAGITVEQGNGSGTFYTTDPNTGQQVQAGTYQWEPPTPQEEAAVDVTNNVINGALLLTGVGRLATGALNLGEGLLNGARSFFADEASSAVGAELGAGASAYPTEIAGYKVSQHVFDRMAEDLGHRVPSQAVEQTIKYGQTMAGRTADVVVKYLPTANVNGVTVAIKQSTQEIIMIRVGRP